MSNVENHKIPAGEILKELFNQDQLDRQTTSDLSEIVKKDKSRIAQVLEFYKADEIKEGPGLWRAAIILQHSLDPELYLLANQFCTEAIEKGENRAKWLYAATLDRFLVSKGLPQKFGTQYKRADSGELELYPVDPSTTEEQREQHNVPRLNT